jgi:hypothetical protein
MPLYKDPSLTAVLVSLVSTHGYQLKAFFLGQSSLLSGASQDPDPSPTSVPCFSFSAQHSYNCVLVHAVNICSVSASPGRHSVQSTLPFPPRAHRTYPELSE